MAPGIAQAGVGPITVPTFPTLVTVGQTNAAGSVTIGRLNTAPNTADVNRVCNAADTNPCSGVGILVIPTCSLLIGGVCQATGADPGVFSPVGTTATGTAGVCANVVFNIEVLPDAFGTWRFTPQGGAHVDLPTNASTCEIGFTFSVIKSPRDQDPVAVGNQTGQDTRHVQCVLPCTPGTLSNNAQGTSNGTTVLRAGPPSITTFASPDVQLGGQLTDQARVTGLVNPIATATVTFRLFPPSDTVCTGTPVFVNPQTVTLSGTTATATSAAFTPTVAGTYRWTATYDGDANNLPVAGLCNDANENRSVTPPPPPPPPPVVCTPPPGPAPPGGTVCETPPVVCTPPPGPAPAGGTLCARGTAAIRGRTGCQGTAFNVVVRGRQIQRVIFALDGRVVRSLTRPNSGSQYVLKVNPRTLRNGVHRVIARTVFRSQSGTRPRVLRVTFSRCQRRAAAPAFTG